jgi:hypothetical protein
VFAPVTTQVPVLMACGVTMLFGVTGMMFS